MKVLIILMLSFVLLVQDNLACTVFYIYRDGVMLGGSNEDWKDPNTRVWFYPSGGEKRGWVKFGFAGGFPQAGMNDKGIFWDGTSNPWQDMPFSEANKEKLAYPLMQKVMEECSSMDEAINVFSAYYCDDQYRGQYLLGGAEGRSVIFDGDHLHTNEYSAQVLTNFHQSNPELGGFPCWRYEQAMQMLDTCQVPSIKQIGAILDATHQEGNYPTQYSVIFDPLRKEIYLFHFHNYHEFLRIELSRHLSADTVSYAVPPLFSKLEMLYPENGAILHADSVILAWRGLSGSTYEVIVKDENDQVIFKSCYSTGRDDRSMQLYYYSIFIIPLLAYRMWNKLFFVTVLFVYLLSSLSCKKLDEEAPGVETMEYTQLVSDLLPGKTYYWNVVAWNNTDAPFKTSSVSFSFTRSTE